MNTDLFSSVPCPVLSAGISQRVGCWHSTFQEHSFPGPKAIQNLGMQKLRNTGIKNWKTGSCISQEQTDGAGSNRTQQPLQEHLPALLQSQQSLLNIRHAQKSSLEIPSKQVCSCTPQIVESPSGVGMLCQSQAWILCFDGGAEGEDCRRPILIKLIKLAPFKELQPHATRGEEENMKL